MEAVRQDGYALRHASGGLKEDRYLMTDAAKRRKTSKIMLG